MTKAGDWTPWGPAQHVEPLREGVELVQTASHGGLRLSTEVAATLPTGFKGFADGGRVWHEEDIDMPMILWFLRLGWLPTLCLPETRLFDYGENVAQHGGRSASNWQALKAERSARMHRSAQRANARFRAARARALAEVAA